MRSGKGVILRKRNKMKKGVSLSTKEVCLGMLGSRSYLSAWPAWTLPKLGLLLPVVSYTLTFRNGQSGMKNYISEYTSFFGFWNDKPRRQKKKKKTQKKCRK